jgi:CSLREA domain-containing protein
LTPTATAKWAAAAALAAGVLGLMPAPAGAATIEVGVTNDELNGDDDCSLREAVQAANTNDPVSGCPKGQSSHQDTVKLEPGEIYALALPSTNEDANANGDLDFTGGGPVRLKGNARGMGGPTIIAPATDRAIDALGGGTLAVKKLNLEGGDVSGLAPGSTDGGTIRADNVRLEIDDVNVEHGAALLGGGIRAGGRNLTITDSFFGQNDATSGGGGIFADDMTTLKISRSGVDSNDVFGATAVGGGIQTLADETKLVDTSVEFNGAETTSAAGGVAAGGGISATSGKLLLRRSLVVGNVAEDAGSTSSSSGGGVHALDGLKVVNATLFGNATDGTGGGILAERASVSHATFANNDGADAGDHLASSGAQALIKFRNSILPGPVVSTDLCAGDPGTFVSKGYNVVEFDDSGCALLDSDAIVTDVGFADGTPLPNGGETFTMGIAASSPAKDLVPRRKCKVAEGEDQRGFGRPKGKRCDAGAFERGASP